MVKLKEIRKAVNNRLKQLQDALLNTDIDVEEMQAVSKEAQFWDAVRTRIDERNWDLDLTPTTEKRRRNKLNP